MNLHFGKILIIDDEFDLSNLVRQYLVKSGFDAISFTSPVLALEHFKSNPEIYRLVITDSRMPNMDGLTLANKIREVNYVIKIFLITAFDISDLDNQINYKNANFSKIIQKPIKLSLLKSMINETLKN